MAKPRVEYVCEKCGGTSVKWQGRCPNCGEWNTMKEFTVVPDSSATTSEARARQALGPKEDHWKSRPIPLSQVAAEEEPRYTTHDHELDRVLGGGIVPGSITLIGGEPGIGKSTLLLQTVVRMADRRVLYVSGEESEKQIKLRADRIANPTTDILLLCETRLEQVFAHIRNVQPDLVVVDSIQTMSVEGIDSSQAPSPKFANVQLRCSNMRRKAGYP